MEVTGKVKLIGDVQTFGASGFRKRELVVETIENYPQSLLIEFIQDNVNALDAYKLDEEVRVFINLKGRKWTNPEGVDKYFNSIQGWKIERLQASGASAPMPGYQSQPAPSAPQTSSSSMQDQGDDEGDLPF